jgi:L-asparaginase
MSETATPRARLLVVVTGGTIRAIGRDVDDLSAYMTTGRQVDAATLLGSAGLATDGDFLRLLDLPTMGGPSTSSADWLALRSRLREAAPDVDAVVVTHGTNTLEEIALFLRLTWDQPIPVVLTGAMRPTSARTVDGPSNLHTAVQVATAPSSRDRGVLVAFGTEVFDARSVRKVTGDALQAVGGGHVGPVGAVAVDGGVRYWHPPFPVPTVPLAGELAELPRVDVVHSAIDGDSTHVDASVVAGAAAIVVDGTGAGHVTTRERAALNEAVAAGVIVCRVSRTGAGAVLPHPLYDGWLAGGYLDAVAARTALRVALAHTSDPTTVQGMLDRLQWCHPRTD